jgi:hypothetical protein
MQLGAVWALGHMGNNYRHMTVEHVKHVTQLLSEQLRKRTLALAITCWLVGLDSTYTVMMEWEREDSRLSSWLPTRRCVMPRLITCRRRVVPLHTRRARMHGSAAAPPTVQMQTCCRCLLMCMGPANALHAM